MTVVIDRQLFTTIDPADATTNWTGRAPIGNLAIDTASKIEGTGCIEGRLQSGTGDATFNHGTLDLTDTPLYCWFRPSSPVDTLANAGVTMRISGTQFGATNYGQWNVGGSDLGVIGSGGWINYSVDLLRAFDSINGTPPAISAPVDSGIGGTFLSGPGMGQPVIDRLERGTTQIVRGGTGGSPGLWSEAATADLANGHIKEIAGAFFINCRVRFGDSIGTTSTEFDDQDGVILFETNLLLAGDICGFEFLGNSTGTNNCQFGTASGTGVDKVGSSGGVWKASGDRPFRVESKDANMDAVGIFGVTLLGPSAIYNDFLRNFKQEDSSGGPSFLDFTREANDSTANDASPFPAGAGVNDAVYFGHNVRFYQVTVNIGTAGVGAYTVTWEYYNGTSWVSLTDLTDGTSAFKTTGSQVVTFTIPDDWAKVTVDTDNRFWIRARRDAGTVTTDPDITQASIGLIGDVELEDSATEMIDCSLSSMGSVRVRGGAFLKRTSVASSLAPAKHAAVDFGSADPATDTVRDLTIANCVNGILLKGTSSGTTTYNFRNIQFAGNTKDVRVDFPSGATIIINVLEGGDTPSIDNVNGSTVNIENPVTTLVNVKDNEAANLQNARVLLEASDGTGDFPFEESVTITRSGATASVSHTAHGLKNNDLVIIRGADQQEYNGPFVITNVTTNAYDYTVSGSPTTPATGTIISSGAILNGLTDASGNISVARTFALNTPLKGSARKSTASPRFKNFILAGTVSSTTGLTINIRLVLDE